MSEIITVALAGAGNRGKNVYAKYTKLFPEKIKLVAVADIDEKKVQEVKEEYGLEENLCFSSVEELLEKDRVADIMFLCTMDRQHYEPAIKAIKKGYHLLLEKPISPYLDECREIERLALKHKRHVLVCHVLRYAPIYQEMKRIIDSDIIGDIVAIDAKENIGYYHFAHSFVRGNWRKSDESTPMIMQKCCHDMDMFLWLTEKHCKSISSYGSLSHFIKDKAPKGSSERCLDCAVKQTCPFDAESIYIESDFAGIRKGVTEWVSMFVLKPDETKVYNALRNGPYGRCVYKCDNDVADHQVVNLLMEDDITISFCVSAFTNSMGRQTHIMGTRGDIIADTDTMQIKVTAFAEKSNIIDVNAMCLDLSGHGGGDRKLIEDVIRIIGDEHSNYSGLTEISRSVESHYMSLAAENSRINNGLVTNLDSFFGC